MGEFRNPNKKKLKNPENQTKNPEIETKITVI
jgi:hypothetical protein